MMENIVYKRTYRPSNGNYPHYINPNFDRNDNGKYCENDPSLYVRAFMLIQKDLQDLFQYIEPHDDNLKCFSLRTHELLVRSCIEIEQNLKGML